MDSLRKCLLEALEALANFKQAVDFKMAFRFIALYVPRCARDKEAARAFQAAQGNLVDSGKKRPR